MTRTRRLVAPFAIILILILLTPHTTAEPLLQLRISLPPEMGALPLAFGHDWGVFIEHGVDLQLVPMADKHSRVAALRAGAIDGMLTDLPTAILLALDGIDLVITSTAFLPQAGSHLALMTQRASEVTSIADLLGEPAAGDERHRIHLPYLSAIHFQTDRLLYQLGYSVDTGHNYQDWPDMLAMATNFAIMPTWLRAVVLPEPYITYLVNFLPALIYGAEIIILSDFATVEPIPSVVVFRRDSLEEKNEAIIRFYTAYHAAIARLNATTFDELLEEGINIAIALFFPGLDLADPEAIPPKEMLAAVTIPYFDVPSLVSTQAFINVMDWLIAGGHARRRIDYAEITTDLFAN